MADKFQNKYRIPSARLQGYDYGQNGYYFITICTCDREYYFGEIVEEEMQLNEIGQLAEKYWLEIPEYFPYIELGNHVVMPNHVHGILIIDKIINMDGGNDRNGSDGSNGSDVIVETRLIASLPTASPTALPTALPTASPTASPTIPPNKTGGITGINNPMFHENISRIMRWYKGRCTFEIHKIHAGFDWQPRFYDNIIRDANSFETIQNYIANNPINWKDDKFYK